MNRDFKNDGHVISPTDTNLSSIITINNLESHDIRQQLDIPISNENKYDNNQFELNLNHLKQE